MTPMLITTTLLNGFRWYTSFYGEEPEDEQIERADFLRLLRREPMQAPGDAILRGRELEDDVRAYCKAGGYKGARSDIRQIGDKCMGGLWQQVCKVRLDGHLLYGRMDVVKADAIRDIKYSKTWDIGKFVRSPQHRIYLLSNPSIPRFIYDVSDGWNAYEEEYRNHAGLADELRGMIHDFFGYLGGDDEARELFNANWKSLS